MFDSSIRRRIAAAVVALALAVPLGASEPRLSSKPGQREAAQTFWRHVDEFLRFLSPGSWSKCGGSADPDGACNNKPSGGSSSTASDSGGSGDPNG
jgi:hypothetical protein